MKLAHLKSPDFAPGKGQEVIALQDFVREAPVDAIVVGAVNIDSRKLFELVINKLRVNNPNTPVFYVEEDVARFFQVSDAGKKEYPEYPELIRNAVSLGRRALDPLHEIASLWPRDLLGLRFHPFQQLVPEGLLRSKLEQSFLNVVSRVGVDINDAFKYPHHSHTLQFVAGLGPRKAAAFFNKMKQHGMLKLRQDLIVLGFTPPDPSPEDSVAMIEDSTRGEGSDSKMKESDSEEELSEPQQVAKSEPKASSGEKIVFQNCSSFVMIHKSDFTKSVPRSLLFLFSSVYHSPPFFDY